MSKEEIKVDSSEEYIDLDELLGTPGGGNIITPSTTEEKTTVFSNKTSDIKIDSTTDDEDNEEEDTSSKVDTIADVINDLEKDKSPSKSEISLVLEKLIEDEILIGFDDDKPFSEYTTEDIKELIQANVQSKIEEVSTVVPKQFFEAQPLEIQMAMKYVADGGSDLKSLFSYLSKSEEVKQLSVDDEKDQEQIVRTYLQASNFGTPEDIEEEIESWKDLDKLADKAQKFKPKLDKMQEQIINQKLAEQEHRRKQQEAMAQKYRDDVFETLKTGSLNGLDVDKKVQSKLFAGLIQPNYPSITGTNTNLLGHLLEKYQFVEPRHDLIAEALWLLSDPDGYKEKLKGAGAQKQNLDTVKKLKNLEQKKDTGSQELRAEESNKKRSLPRNTNFFARDIK